MKSIKSKIQISMLSVVLIGSILIGTITAFLNAYGVNTLMEKTVGPAAKVAADAVEWRMDSYWTALQEAAESDIFRNSEPTAAELVPIRDEIAERNGFLYTGKMDADGYSSNDYSYANEEYFQQCKKTMKPYISDIMSDGNQMIFLLEVPIIVDGRFDGVVYGGISADFLSKLVIDLGIGNDGVTYVLDKRGNVIAHREQSVVEEGSNMIEAAKEDSSLSDIAAVNQRMIQGETGFGAYNFFGDNKFISFAPIGGNQEWSIALELSQREFKSSLDRSILLTILVVLLVVISTFPAAIKMGRSISDPIQVCINRLESLAVGDLHSPMPEVTSKDETAKLVAALEATTVRMHDVLLDMSRHLNLMSQGDFSKEVTRTYVGDFVTVKTSITTINNSLKEMLQQVQQSAEAVSAGAMDVNSGSQALNAGVVEQTNAINELSTTMDDVAENVSQTSSIAKTAGQSVQQTSTQLESSVDIVNELNVAMERIASSSAEIGKIIGTIENIAFQTNILALNAAVEAARAGEAGQGFSMVADEVRDLARKSNEAAKATKELIEGSIASVAEGGQVIERAMQSMQKTSDIAKNVTVQIKEVVTAVESQTEAITLITEGIDQISTVVQNTSAIAEESVATSQQLAHHSMLMNEAVHKFRLE